MMKKKQIGFLAAASLLLLQAPFVSFAGAWEKENGVYVNASGGAISGAVSRGVSVSKYQGTIDWAKVRADDISFAMPRLGYLNSEDPTFDFNMRQAAANGIDTGLYLYSQALSVEQAREEARFSVRRALDYRVSYPIAIDLESQWLIMHELSVQELTDIVNAFCSEVEAAGYYPVLYVNQKWMTEKVDMSQIPYDVWYARYKELTEFPVGTGIWQSTQSGSVDGIEGDVCLEFSFLADKSKLPADTWHKVDGAWYYCKNYEKQTGWCEVNGAWYYLDPQRQGMMAADTVMEINGVSCRFSPDGAWMPEHGETSPMQAGAAGNDTFSGSGAKNTPGGPASAAGL